MCPTRAHLGYEISSGTKMEKKYFALSLMARRAWVLCVGALVLRDAHAIAVLRTPCAATRGAVSVPRQTSALLALDAPADVFPDAYASAAERDAAYEKAVLAVRDAAAKFGGNQAEVAERWARAQIDECPVAMDADRALRQTLRFTHTHTPKAPHAASSLAPAFAGASRRLQLRRLRQSHKKRCIMVAYRRERPCCVGDVLRVELTQLHLRRPCQSHQ